MISLSNFLPQWMLSDSTAIGLVAALDEQLQAALEHVEIAYIYSTLDKLNESVLDELAWQFNVLEYNSEYSLQTKRKLVKRCMKTHSTRGTKFAVEKIVQDIFEDGYVEEWYEYGGKPGYFRIKTGNIGTSDEMLAALEQSILSVKRCSAWLEGILAEDSIACELKFSAYCRDAEIIRI